MTPNSAQTGRPVPKLKTGCFGCLATVIIVPLFAYVLAAPVSFHLGGRWTPIGRWTGVGRLRDSAGVLYGLYLRINAAPNIDMRNEATTCCEISGDAQVCTAGGAQYRFHVTGSLSGAWLRSDGAKVSLALSETGHPRVSRTFRLAGIWRGPDLVLDDEKTMFTNFFPGGNLTPNTTTTAPVPEKHAKVTVSWGDLRDFDRVCASIHAPG